MKQNGVLCYPGPALLFSIFRFRARKVTGTFEKRAPDRVRGLRLTLPSNRVKFLCGPLKEWKKITPSGQKIESVLRLVDFDPFYFCLFIVLLWL